MPAVSLQHREVAEEHAAPCQKPGHRGRGPRGPARPLVPAVGLQHHEVADEHADGQGDTQQTAHNATARRWPARARCRQPSRPRDLNCNLPLAVVTVSGRKRAHQGISQLTAARTTSLSAPPRTGSVGYHLGGRSSLDPPGPSPWKGAACPPAAAQRSQLRRPFSQEGLCVALTV